MDIRTQVAHHEAAHVVVSAAFGLEIPERGIDLDAATSVDGAFGNALVNLFVDDPSLSDEQRRKDLVTNVAVVCAGPASDARLLGRSLREALSMQPSDEAIALQLIRASPLLEGPAASHAEEAELVIEAGLEAAEAKLGVAANWEAVEAVARAAVQAGGALSKDGIERVLKATWPDWEPPT